MIGNSLKSVMPKLCRKTSRRGKKDRASYDVLSSRFCDHAFFEQHGHGIITAHAAYGLNLGSGNRLLIRN